MLGNFEYFLLFCFLIGSLKASLSGPNVCTFQETFIVSETVPVEVFIKVKTYKFCWSIPPRCTKEKLVQITRMQLQTRTEVRSKKFCCEGYIKLDAENICTLVPVVEKPNVIELGTDLNADIYTDDSREEEDDERSSIDDASIENTDGSSIEKSGEVPYNIAHKIGASAKLFLWFSNVFGG